MGSTATSVVEVRSDGETTASQTSEMSDGARQVVEPDADETRIAEAGARQTRFTVMRTELQDAATPTVADLSERDTGNKTTGLMGLMSDPTAAPDDYAGYGFMPDYIRGSVGKNTGAAVASIPIEVFPGPNGLAPELSLTYSSNVVEDLLFEGGNGAVLSA